MSDYGETMSALDRFNRQQRADASETNTAAIAASGIPHRVANEGQCICFRERGKPRVDYYPSTSRWRIAGPNERAKSGTVEEFLAWYRELSSSTDGRR